LEDIAIDEAGRRRQRCETRRDAVGQVEVAEALEGLFAREVVVGAVLEREGDIGEAVQGDGADHLHLGESVHFDFDRHGDQPLDFLGGVTGPLRDDLDHRRREVGVGVHRQPPERPDARANEEHAEQRDEKPLAERSADEAVDVGLLGVAPVRPLGPRGRCVGRGRTHWLCANCRNRPPSDTTLSPGVSPDAIWYCSASRSPSVTDRRAKAPFGSCTYTNGLLSSSRSTAAMGTSRPECSWCECTVTRTYMSFLRRRAGLATTTRAAVALVVESTSAAMLSTVPWNTVADALVTTSAWSPNRTSDRSDSKTLVMTHMRERSATVKHGVVPA